MIRFGLISMGLGLIGCSDSTISSTEKGLAVECGEGTVLVDGVCTAEEGDTDLDGDGYSVEDGDCDDTDERLSPGRTEVCDGRDNDCDGTADEDAADARTWYLDHDGDAYGDPDWPHTGCEAPYGFLPDNTDCDDTRADVFPGAPDELYDGVDSNCDGSSEWDGDGDGHDAPVGGGDDCDDADPLTYPGAADEPYDGYDSDCGGDDDYDADGDGYVPDEYAGLATAGVEGSGDLPDGDCDDSDASIHPRAAETSDDGIDSDCDGEDSFVGLSGETGDAWVAVPPGPGLRGLQEFLELGDSYMYVGNSSAGFARLDLTMETWESLASPPGALANWGSAARGNDDGLWQVRAGQAFRYDEGANTWSTVSGLTTYSDEQTMTITDSEGKLWAFQGGSTLLRYDPSTGESEIHTVESPPYVFETRMGYDRATNSIFFGGFADDEVYQYQIDTGVTDTTRERHPEGFLNDIFCSDRSGHLYAAGSSSGTTLWQYDIELDTWELIPDFPIDHGNNGSCSVAMDGWLYMEPVSVTSLYKLPLY